MSQKLPILVILITLCSLGASAQNKIEKASPTIPAEYVDVIQLSLTKNCYVDVKGTLPLSVDVSGDRSAISLGIQENSNIIKLKAQKRGFAEANMIIVCKDTVLQFLIRYTDVANKTYYPYDVAQLKKKSFEAIAANRAAADVKVGNSAKTDNSQKPWRDSSATIDTRYGIEGRNTPLTKPQSSPVKDSVVNKELPKEDRPLNGNYLREEVFEKLRSKPVNLQIGDLDGGVRVVLDRMYRDGDAYYYAVTIYNREKKDFPIDYTGFEVHRKTDNQNTNTDLVRLYQPNNNPSIVTSSAKTSLMFCTGKIEMAPEEFLLINITGGDKEIKIKLKKTDFDRAVIFKM